MKINCKLRWIGGAALVADNVNASERHETARRTAISNIRVSAKDCGYASKANWASRRNTIASRQKLRGTTFKLLLVGLSGFLGLVNIAPAPISEISPVSSFASSADGGYLVAIVAGIPDYGNTIYCSTNGGGTWKAPTTPAAYWRAVASSADGRRLAAAADLIYTSSDYGATWVPTSAPTNNWLCLASSADGTELLAAAFPGLIYASTNSGVTWTPTSAPSNSWSCLASSADGTRLVAGVGIGPEGIAGQGVVGPIYRSSDSGRTWTIADAPTTNSWSTVASSADGTKLVAAGGSGEIYTSTNSGATWALTSAPNENWVSVAMSADGTKMAAAAEQGSFPKNILTSTNTGITWTQAAVGGFPVVLSADGNKALAATGVASEGGLESVAVAFPPFAAPSLSLTSPTPVVSWLVPSSSFVLQQSSDLSSGSWVDVTNQPTLNFTNLHYEETLPPPSGNRFYRLKQQ